MNPGARFRQARNSQPTKVPARVIAEALGVTDNAIRHMENNNSKELLEKAIAHFGPLWNLDREWFFTSSVKEERRPYNLGDLIDLPAYIGTIKDSRCEWDMSIPPSTRPIRLGFLSASPSEYLLLIAAGTQHAPRIEHGAILLVRKSTIVPPGTITLAQPKDIGRCVIGVFNIDPNAEYEDFRTIGLEDKIIGQIEMIHHPTIAGPNLEFDNGRPLLVQKSQMLYQSS